MKFIESDVTGEIILLKMQSGDNNIKFLNHLKTLKSVNILLKQGEIKLETPLEDEKVTKLIPYILIRKNAGIMRTKAARKYIPENLGISPLVSNQTNKTKVYVKNHKKISLLGEEKKGKVSKVKVVTVFDKTKGKNTFKFRVGNITEFTCGECETVFQRNVDLQIHLLKHIQRKRPLVKLYSYNLPKKFHISNNEDMYLKPKEKRVGNNNDEAVDTNQGKETVEIDPVNQNSSTVNNCNVEKECCLENVISTLENDLEELCLQKENSLGNCLDLDDVSPRKRKFSKSILVNSPKENGVSPKFKKVRFSSEKIIMCDDNSISKEIIEDKDSIYDEDNCPDLHLSDIEDDVDKGEEFLEKPPEILIEN